MDVQQAVRRLRVIRNFSSRQLPDDDVQAILEAGRRAGSSKNTQRRQFIVIRDRDRLERLSKVGDYAGHLAGAAVGIALVTPGRDGSAMWDLGLVAQNMFLTAWARGIGSVPATVYRQDECRQILRYPQEEHCEYVLSFGYPADPRDLKRPLRRGGRRPLDEIIHQEEW